MNKITLKLIQNKPIFGRLSLTGEYKTKKSDSGKSKTFVEAVCECGIKKYYNLSQIKYGHTKSCGCVRKEYYTRVKKGKKEKGKKKYVPNHVLGDIKVFCDAHDMKLDTERMTIDNAKIYIKDSRCYYEFNNVDVIKDYYLNNSVRTEYRENGIKAYFVDWAQ